MTSLPRCFDAAYPPSSPPAGAAAVLGYIGNHRDDRDVHIWTPPEWQPFAGLAQFPCWELAPWLDAVTCADDVVAAMRALGWFPGRAVVGAMETFAAPDWWHRFEQRIIELGQVPVCYGSLDTVFGNQAQHYWVAHYDNRPVLDNPAWWAKQYQALAAVDWSVISPALLEHAGHGPRKQ